MAALSRVSHALRRTFSSSSSASILFTSTLRPLASSIHPLVSISRSFSHHPAPATTSFNPITTYGQLDFKIMSAPHKYVQKPGALADFAVFVKHLVPQKGGKVVVLCSKTGRQRMGTKIEGSLIKHCGDGVQVHFVEFGGECSWDEVAKIIKKVGKGVDVLVSVGGGKCIDAGKLAAYKCSIPSVVVPTLASTDAPCSALSVMYHPDGTFNEVVFYPDNPYAVIVDTQVIVEAPKRFLLSGMGDALSTYYEAESCSRSKTARNCVGGIQSSTALALARLCRDLLFEHGVQAMRDMDRKPAVKVTDSIEQIVEANTLLSGLGFESGGLAGAHALHNGFTALPATHKFYHGEKVAVGTCVHLALGSQMTELNTVMRWCKQVGLPFRPSHIGVNVKNQAELKLVAEGSTKEGESIHNMPERPTASDVMEAMRIVEDRSIRA